MLAYGSIIDFVYFTFLVRMWLSSRKLSMNAIFSWLNEFVNFWSIHGYFEVIFTGICPSVYKRNMFLPLFRCAAIWFWFHKPWGKQKQSEVSALRCWCRSPSALISMISERWAAHSGCHSIVCLIMIFIFRIITFSDHLTRLWENAMLHLGDCGASLIWLRLKFVCPFLFWIHIYYCG